MTPDPISSLSRDECYVSVDIEAAGPIPGKYSMLSIGACLVAAPAITFYAELRPISTLVVPAAIETTGLSVAALTSTGRPPQEAMREFRLWLSQHCEPKPIFVGFNASFDWSFVNWYFHQYLDENPFGIAALDIKSYYMGLSGCLWSETTSSRMPPAFQPAQRQNHHALDDAVAQAEIFLRLLAWPR